MGIRLTIMEQLLVENRKQQVLNKFTSRRGKNFVNKVANADPSGNQKYLAWFVKKLTNYNDQSEYLLSNDYNRKNRAFSKLIEAVIFFHNHQDSFELKDINQYRTIEDLYAAVEVVKIKVRDKELIKLAKQGSTKVYEDNNIFVVMPKNHKASCYYGRGTRWCTTMEQSPGYFKRYTSQGFLFYFIVKSPVPDDRFSYKTALLLGTGEDLMDILEDELDFEYAAEDYTGNADGLRDFLDDHGCRSDECVTEQVFDAADNVYDNLRSVMGDHRRWKNNEAVTNSYNLAYDVIMETYKPKLEEFSNELLDIAKKSFISLHKMSVGSSHMETLSDILRKAGVTDFDNLSFSDATTIINDYISDNSFDHSELGDINTSLDSRYPLENR